MISRYIFCVILRRNNSYHSSSLIQYSCHLALCYYACCNLAYDEDKNISCCIILCLPINVVSVAVFDILRRNKPLNADREISVRNKSIKNYFDALKMSAYHQSRNKLIRFQFKYFIIRKS